jgi:hypothetical protein
MRVRDGVAERSNIQIADSLAPEFLRDFVVPALGLAPAAPAWAQSRLVPRFPSFM